MWGCDKNEKGTGKVRIEGVTGLESTLKMNECDKSKGTW